jgi:Icc-related predicted phosphoesterase
MQVTFISDTHTKQNSIKPQDLPGGDILIHSGDCMNTGLYEFELIIFLDWFSSLDQYTHKILIAGNHDWLFETKPKRTQEILQDYPNVTYLQDQSVEVMGLNIYGSPWQPEFNDWAFNVPRNSTKMEEIWNQIPENTDILVTHGPPFSILDYVHWSKRNAGCELLYKRVMEVKPLIHCFGHIHNSGYRQIDGINFFNASVLNENYDYVFKPININITSKEIDIL